MLGGDGLCCGITIVSRKGIDPSALASSVVNWMCGSMLLMCSRKLFFFAEFMTTQVSSTYFFQILGGYSSVLMALVFTPEEANVEDLAKASVLTNNLLGYLEFRL